MSNPNHHINLGLEARKDIHAWLEFLSHYNGKSILLNDKWVSSNHFRLFSDASGLGYAAILGSHWFQGSWPKSWRPLHIAIKELFPIVLAVQVWGNLLKNNRLLLLCDYKAVVDIINDQSSKDKLLMSLLRTLTVSAMQYNLVLAAKHVKGKYNVVADALSRFQNKVAFEQAQFLDQLETPVPDSLLPWCQ